MPKGCDINTLSTLKVMPVDSSLMAKCIAAKPYYTATLQTFVKKIGLYSFTQSSKFTLFGISLLLHETLKRIRGNLFYNQQISNVPISQSNNAHRLPKYHIFT